MKNMMRMGFVLLMVLAGSVASAQEEIRVMRAYFAGNVVFQTPASGLDSIKADDLGYVTVHYSDATWSRQQPASDSVSSESDQTCRAHGHGTRPCRFHPCSWRR